MTDCLNRGGRQDAGGGRKVHGCSSAGGSSAEGGQIVTPLFGQPLIHRQNHFFLGVDTKSVGNAIDIVEITDDLCGDSDLLIIESRSTKRGQMMFRETGGGECQSDGVVAQRPVSVTQIGPAIVKHQLFSQFGISGLQTEVVCM